MDSIRLPMLFAGAFVAVASPQRIGENTQGVFSDVLGRRLPNGWRFGLPNEVFRTPRGTTFDGTGIAPDVSAPVFADEDVAAGRDPGIAKALQVLWSK